MSLKVLDLFSGIGGFSLGLERAGMETIAFCEFDKHAQRVLKKHWPDIPIYEDVRTLDGKQFRGSVDLVCGGFPCQDLSVAGKKAGFEGERSSLYREMLRIISECRPRYAIFENVTGLLTGEQGRWFAQFLYDLAEVGYDAEWHCISASELGAHHHRDRVWIIAYPYNDGQASTKEQRGATQGGNTDATRQGNAKQSKRCCSSSINELLADTYELYGQKRRYDKSNAKEGGKWGTQLKRGRANDRRLTDAKQDEILADTTSKRQSRQGESIKSECEEAQRDRKTSIFESMCIRGEWEAEPELGRVANGIPDRVDRLTRLGNAVVPQIPEIIGRAILECEKDK